MRTLQIFLDVARHRSFSDAAAEHGVTQSAASQRVSQLEKKLGVTLIDRSVRPLALTPAGEEFLRGCRDILERYADLERRVTRHRPAFTGHLSVAAIYSAGIDLLNHVREAFIRDHPGVSVEVQYQQPDEVYDSVRDQRCDLGIVSYPQRWRDVGTIPLRDERMVVVFGPTHELAGRARLRASELADWPMVTFEPALPVGRHIRRYLKEQGVVPQITNLFDNIDTVKSAVAVTDQLAILPKRTVQREVTAGTLAAAELEPELLRPIGIIHRRGSRGQRPLSPMAQGFVDFLLHHAGPHVDLAGRIETQGRIQGRNPSRPLAGAK